MGRDKRIAKDWRRLGGVVDMQGGCLCLIVCPICLALSLLSTPLASPPPTSPLPPPPPPVPPSPTNSSHPPLYTQSPQPGRWPGVFHPMQLVALFTCTTHICAQLLGCLQSLYSCRPGASAGIKGLKHKTLIHIRWLKGWMGLKGPPSPVLHIVPLNPYISKMLYHHIWQVICFPLSPVWMQGKITIPNIAQTWQSSLTSLTEK